MSKMVVPLVLIVFCELRFKQIRVVKLIGVQIIGLNGDPERTVLDLMQVISHE